MPKICTLVSPLLNGADFTLSVAKNVALFETVPILRKIRTLRFNLPLSNGCVTGDRSTETNDRFSGCTVVLFIEKMNQINTKNYWK